MSCMKLITNDDDDDDDDNNLWLYLNVFNWQMSYSIVNVLHEVDNE